MKKFLSVLILILAMSFALLSPALADQSLTLKNGFNFISFNQSLSLTAAQLKQLNASIEDVYLYSPASGSFLSAGEGTLSSLLIMTVRPL
ncbi:MAG TPA: hypothetical protein PK467_01755 [Candidatus Wallbacteria bacterium]|nr:hypothetical protein [Candidatus Wallbacteria bacterium]